jgi:hypothetical protein
MVTHQDVRFLFSRHVVFVFKTYGNRRIYKNLPVDYSITGLFTDHYTTLSNYTNKKRCNYCNLVKRCQQSLDQSKVCFLFLFSAFCRHLVLRPLCHVCIPILYLSVSVRKKENKNETDATNKNEKYKKNVPVSL